MRNLFDVITFTMSPVIHRINMPLVACAMMVSVDNPVHNRVTHQHIRRSHILRAKIDMTSSNMLMRDPIMYRIINANHHRTGDQWHIYPMYDWAHGESDYIEQISHSLCTLEFLPHRELYDWFLDQIYEGGKTRPKQREFARRNLSHTVVSKRKLSQLV